MYAPTSNSCIFTPTENWTHFYMNLFTWNSPYYHLLKYLLFLLKHPVYEVKLSFCSEPTAHHTRPVATSLRVRWRRRRRKRRRIYVCRNRIQTPQI